MTGTTAIKTGAALRRLTALFIGLTIATLALVGGCMQQR